MDLVVVTTPPPPPAASVAAACARAAALGRPVLLSLARPLAEPPDPLLLVAAARRAGATAALLERRADGVAIAGLGAAWSRDAGGAQRIDAIRDDAVALFAEAVVDGDVAPLAIAAFAFAPTTPGGDWHGFPAARAIVPRIVLLRRDGATTRVVNLLVEPGEDVDAVARRLQRALARLATWRAAVTDDGGHPCYVARPEPEPAAWKRAVATTVDDIAAGRLNKLVLARTCRLEADDPFACAAAAARLRQGYPTCTTFWLGGAAGDFLGATPEVLVRVHGRTLATAALAGTIARGTTTTADAALARTLLASGKDRHEHAIVVEALRVALQPLCDELMLDAAPEVVRLANVHHLRTAVRG
ncbi:MAG TPA: chorismate-binding protein, partial [Candidatus Dormibacteraeota bacterium]|nr:chorismate-binding protein [Candidatus Dormibacteraeota bacterium]